MNVKMNNYPPSNGRKMLELEECCEYPDIVRASTQVFCYNCGKGIMQKWKVKT